MGATSHFDIFYKEVGDQFETSTCKNVSFRRWWSMAITQSQTSRRNPKNLLKIIKKKAKSLFNLLDLDGNLLNKFYSFVQLFYKKVLFIYLIDTQRENQSCWRLTVTINLLFVAITILTCTQCVKRGKAMKIVVEPGWDLLIEDDHNGHMNRRP